ncbi:hypothetical protein HNR60_000755 [Rhodopseudomonas rhenobacensis]|uniref:Uncharacterized protein n=1 Tax=Rhodopseudomonas rhenobacensis TaxID=87461 RepID=A0A7W7Z0Y6_9BRAD|nr:hypothetical protein [Rhodopseudomonas rhenobacensis]MBB5046013.1 hypothetical protein [Rhodopseudomonas rhenobacensis]
MQTVETTDLKEARRSRIAQFSGRSATLSLGGKTVTGLVRAVREDKASAVPRWLITIVADKPKSSAKPLIIRPDAAASQARA